MPFNWNNLPSLFGSRLRKPSNPFGDLGSYDYQFPQAPRDTTYDEPPTPVEDDPMESIMARLFGASQNAGPASSRYQQHIETLPDRKDYAPSKWRRLGAILAGIGSKNGYETSSGIINDPYNQAVTDWGMRGKGLQESAAIESDDTKARMTALIGMLGQRRLQQTADRTGKEQTRINDARIADYEARRSLYPAQVRNYDSQSQGRVDTANYQRGMLDLGRGNLGVNQVNSRTNAGRLQQDQNQFDTTFNYAKGQNNLKNLMALTNADNATTRATNDTTRANAYADATVAPISGTSFSATYKNAMKETVLKHMQDAGSYVDMATGNVDFVGMAEENPGLLKQILAETDAIVKTRTTRVRR